MASRKNRIKALKIISVLLCIMLIASIAVCFILVKNVNKKANEEKQKMQLQLDESIKENDALKNKYADSYTKEQVDEMLASKSETSYLEGKDSVRDFIKEYVTTDDPTLSDLLRKIYPELIVYPGTTGYIYLDIDETLEKVQINTESFTREDNGTLTYSASDNIVCKKGIDVSQFQNHIDWEKVKDYGIDYAIVRVGIRGYGSGLIVLDKEFENNMKGLSDNNIDAGVYFFSQAISEEEAIEEADFVLESIAPYNVTYPVCLDIERITDGNARADKLSKEDRTAYAIAFCERVKEKGYTPMIYGNMYTLYSMLDMGQIKDYDIWFAFYNDYLYFPYKINTWQYTEKLSIPGISTKVDGNITFISE